MNKTLLLTALMVPLFSSGLRGDPPLKFSMVTLEEDSAITAEIESMMRDEALPKFAEHYTLNAPMRHWIREHRAGTTSWFHPGSKMNNGFSDSANMLLMITTFDDRQHGERRAVSIGSVSSSWLEIFNLAVRENWQERLDSRRFMQIVEALEKLPDENEYPPVSELAIVSFHKDDEWVTRTFRAATVQNLLSLLMPDYRRPRYLGFGLSRPPYMKIPFSPEELRIQLPPH